MKRAGAASFEPQDAPEYLVCTYYLEKCALGPLLDGRPYFLKMGPNSTRRGAWLYARFADAGLL
jgi:hypothetical protein